MAISSITRNFVISGKEQVEMFADAIERSANDCTPPPKVHANYLTDPAEIVEFTKKRNCIKEQTK